MADDCRTVGLSPSRSNRELIVPRHTDHPPLWAAASAENRWFVPAQNGGYSRGWIALLQLSVRMPAPFRSLRSQTGSQTTETVRLSAGSRPWPPSTTPSAAPTGGRVHQDTVLCILDELDEAVVAGLVDPAARRRGSCVIRCAPLGPSQAPVPCQHPRGGLTWGSRLGVRARTPCLPVHGPRVRLAGAPGAHRCGSAPPDPGVAA